MMAKKVKKSDEEEDLKMAFKVEFKLEIKIRFLFFKILFCQIFDRDGNGTISASEFKHALTTYGEVLSDDEVDQMMREADLNGDGTISYEGNYYILD